MISEVVGVLILSLICNTVDLYAPGMPKFITYHHIRKVSEYYSISCDTNRCSNSTP